MKDIELATMKDAVEVMRKKTPKAIVVTENEISIVDLPEYGTVGLVIVNKRFDRVDYQYSKKLKKYK